MSPSDTTIALGERLDVGRAKGRLAVFFKNINLGDDRGEQPAMILGRRAFGRGRSFFIPLATAHEYTDERLAAQHVAEIADHLYWGMATRADHIQVMDTILANLEQLIRFKPEEATVEADAMQQFIEDHGVVLDLNGQRLIDGR